MEQRINFFETIVNQLKGELDPIEHRMQELTNKVKNSTNAVAELREIVSRANTTVISQLQIENNIQMGITPLPAAIKTYQEKNEKLENNMKNNVEPVMSRKQAFLAFHKKVNEATTTLKQISPKLNKLDKDVSELDYRVHSLPYNIRQTTKTWVDGHLIDQSQRMQMMLQRERKKMGAKSAFDY